MEPRVLRISDVRKLIGLHKSTIYRMIAAKKFPQPIRLGPKSVGFLREEIDEWIATRPRAGTEDPDSVQ